MSRRIVRLILLRRRSKPLQMDRRGRHKKRCSTMTTTGASISLTTKASPRRQTKLCCKHQQKSRRLAYTPLQQQRLRESCHGWSNLPHHRQRPINRSPTSTHPRNNNQIRSTNQKLQSDNHPSQQQPPLHLQHATETPSSTLQTLPALLQRKHCQLSPEFTFQPKLS